MEGKCCRLLDCGSNETVTGKAIPFDASQLANRRIRPNDPLAKFGIHGSNTKSGNRATAIQTTHCDLIAHGAIPAATNDKTETLCTENPTGFSSHRFATKTAHQDNLFVHRHSETAPSPQEIRAEMCHEMMVCSSYGCLAGLQSRFAEQCRKDCLLKA
ncbi:hypothetical protein K239x_53980 [Planctomycetes bacterium K23_9]|uniref:Uncharacterized protein n=1 Tax=Stieleria marina TaxID=1930275 RepID=A0A517P1Y1_9BACT|nr:hypothetical protein K239x_53980 [Planctomycetes bacterium K23_9]